MRWAVRQTVGRFTTRRTWAKDSSSHACCHLAHGLVRLEVSFMTVPSEFQAKFFESGAERCAFRAWLWPKSRRLFQPSRLLSRDPARQPARLNLPTDPESA